MRGSSLHKSLWLFRETSLLFLLTELDGPLIVTGRTIHNALVSVVCKTGPIPVHFFVETWLWQWPCLGEGLRNSPSKITTPQSLLNRKSNLRLAVYIITRGLCFTQAKPAAIGADDQTIQPMVGRVFDVSSTRRSRLCIVKAPLKPNL